MFDDVARGLNLVGEKAQELVGPGLGFGEGGVGGFVESRDFEERCPVGEGAVVSLTNEFGEIRVSAWDNQVVQVTAKISVRAESADLAREIAQSIVINIVPSPDAVEVRTVLPDTRNARGKPTIEVLYGVTVPKNAHVAARNDFGDVVIAGVGGTVRADVRYGAVSLSEIGGPVTVRARGEFPLDAQGLRQGGTFEIHGVRASFRNIAGALKIDSFRGAVDLRDLPAETTVDVASESGPINLWLPENAAPDIVAAVAFGDLLSDLPLNRTSQGDFSVARGGAPDSKQHISLRASFSDIAIQRREAEQTARPAAPQASQPFKEVITHTENVVENTAVAIEAIPGDVRVTGVDENVVRIAATKFVRVQSQSNVRAALQALDVRTVKEDTLLRIRTSVTDNMAALGCTYYRVDLVVECPRTVTLNIQSQEGHTAVADVGGTTVVKQAAGTIAVEHVKADINLTNQKGDIQVTSCAGPVEVAASYGTVTLKDIFGKMTATTLQGKTVIESPHAEIVARSTGGDVRIISLDGVDGNYDIRAEQGNISIVLPPSTDASLSATVVDNGAVRSAIPLTGSIKKGLQEFIRNAGPLHVTLQTKNGDILIN